MIKNDFINKLQTIAVQESPREIADDLTEGEIRRIDYEKKLIELREKEAELKNRKDALDLSRCLARAISFFVFTSLATVFGILIWQGNIEPSLRLSDKVLITLLSTMTINIIGLLYLVVKYVFHHWLKL